MDERMEFSGTAKESHGAVVPNKLGTFGGVFTPSILTILGVIMFMRAGYVIGEAGIFHALLILLLAKTITTLTALSISAVSTNTPVSGGGAYFLISRSLGPEFGGAIGLALYSAQAISVPFYILGFTEALVRTFPEMNCHFQPIALTAAAVLFFIAYVGAKWAIKTQYLIMAILCIAILAFLGGAVIHFQGDQFFANWSFQYSTPGASFWRVFAIYFPAVTGIMAGVNMSGDLKNPGRSIPWGTLLAVGTGFLVYALQILLVGGAQLRVQLLNASFETLCDQALFGSRFMVVAGVFAATLSSALGSFLGAPRVLQAVARDNVVEPLRPFAKGSPRGDEPHRALGLTLAVTVAVIFWAGQDSAGGAFNVLAAVVTMFFLYTYGMVNLAAFVESSSGNPSFRPRFKYYHWLPAMFGALACAGTALLIDTLAAVLAFFAVAGLYGLLCRRVLQVRFGDARWGFAYSRLRRYLLKLARFPFHPKNWRPTVLVLTGNPETRFTMAMYGLWIGEERGLVVLARVLVGDIVEIANLRQIAITQLDRFIQDNEFNALSTVLVSRDLDEGFTALLQGHFIGPLRPNLVLMGWSSDRERAETFARRLNSVRLLGMSLILVKDNGLPKRDRPQRIDLWWRGLDNGALLIMLAHLLTLSWGEANAKIRLLRLVSDEAGRQPSTESLQKLVAAARVTAQVEILVSTDSFPEVLKRHSQDAAVVLLGFKIPEEGKAEGFHGYFEEMLSGLPTTLLICSSGEVDVLS